MSESSVGLRSLTPKGYGEWARKNIGDFANGDDDIIAAHKRIDENCDKLLEIFKKMKTDAEESNRKCKEISDKFNRTCWILIAASSVFPCIVVGYSWLLH